MNIVKLYRRKKLQKMAREWGMEQITIDMEGLTHSVRLHLHPSKFGPSPLIINSQKIILLNPGPAMLMRIYMQELKKVGKPGRETPDAEMDVVKNKVASRMHKLYPDVMNHEARFEYDLGYIHRIIVALANGEWPEELKGMEPMSLTEYAPHMLGPIRMDLAVMPTTLDGVWSCNNSCLGCYAMTGEGMKVDSKDLLTLVEWKEVLDILWNQAGVSQVSFTGGEPTGRKDLVELIAMAREFITRLNTNGRKLADLAYCEELVKAELDVVQVTVYSHDDFVHNTLVGAKGALAETLQGIKNALMAKLEVSVNIPLVDLNVRGLAETVTYLNEELGVRYFSCSGMLPAGGATKLIANGRIASQDILFRELKRAKAKAAELNIELEFTSPGTLSPEQYKELGIDYPVCGACLGNMSVSPTGNVWPCQSWVHDAAGLGNILTTPWKDIWESPKCVEIRKRAADKPECPLSTEVKS